MDAKTVLNVITKELINHPMIIAFYSLQDKEFEPTIEDYVNNLLLDDFHFSLDIEDENMASAYEIYFHFKNVGKRPSFALEDTLMVLLKQIGDSEVDAQTCLIEDAINSGIKYLQEQD